MASARGLETRTKLVVGSRSSLEDVRQRIADDQRVVAAGHERLRHAAEHAAAVVLNRRCLAVHQLRGAHDLPSKCDADALMSQAYAEHRDRRSESLDQLDRDARVFRTTRTRRNHDVVGLHRSDFVERNLVVALDHRRRPKLAEILGEVEGE